MRIRIPSPWLDGTNLSALRCRSGLVSRTNLLESFRGTTREHRNASQLVLPPRGWTMTAGRQSISCLPLLSCRVHLSRLDCFPLALADVRDQYVAAWKLVHQQSAWRHDLGDLKRGPL